MANLRMGLWIGRQASVWVLLKNFNIFWQARKALDVSGQFRPSWTPVVNAAKQTKKQTDQNIFYYDTSSIYTSASHAVLVSSAQNSLRHGAALKIRNQLFEIFTWPTPVSQIVTQGTFRVHSQNTYLPRHASTFSLDAIASPSTYPC